MPGRPRVRGVKRDSLDRKRRRIGERLALGGVYVEESGRRWELLADGSIKVGEDIFPSVGRAFQVVVLGES